MDAEARDMGCEKGGEQEWDAACAGAEIEDAERTGDATASEEAPREMGGVGFGFGSR